MWVKGFGFPWRPRVPRMSPMRRDFEVDVRILFMEVDRDFERAGWSNVSDVRVLLYGSYLWGEN